MGIKIEFNPDLALRDFSEFEKGQRQKEECIPNNLEAGKTYEFLKEGQRVYWLNNDPEWFYGEMPLFKTEGNEKLSRPIASIKILEVTHLLREGKIYTEGKYKVIDVFDINKPDIHFEGCKRVK